MTERRGPLSYAPNVAVGKLLAKKSPRDRFVLSKTPAQWYTVSEPNVTVGEHAIGAGRLSGQPSRVAAAPRRSWATFSPRAAAHNAEVR